MHAQQNNLPFQYSQLPRQPQICYQQPPIANYCSPIMYPPQFIQPQIASYNYTYPQRLQQINPQPQPTQAKNTVVKYNGKQNVAQRGQTQEKVVSPIVNQKNSQPQSNLVEIKLTDLKSKEIRQIDTKANPLVQNCFNKKQKNKEEEPKLNKYVNQLQRTDDQMAAEIHILANKSSEIYYISDLLAALQDEQGQLKYSQLFREHITIQFNFVPIIQQIPFDQEQLIMRKLQIPRQQKKFNKTIVFDLDETLVHCNEDEKTESQIRLPVVFPTGEEVMAGINVRLFAKEIIMKLSEVCEVMIFTASHECYANKVIDYLDPDNRISQRIFRDSCITVGDGYLVKNLEVIDRDLKDLVLIDNASYSFGHHLENGIPILSYYDDTKDTQLIKLYRFLTQQILTAEDVRPVIEKQFKLSKFKDFETLQDAVQQLYCQ